MRRLPTHLEVQLLFCYSFPVYLFSFHSCLVQVLQFGDHDGMGSEVLLQHPLGVLCGKDGQIYIADSYNHKVLTDGCLTEKNWHDAK